MSLIVRKGKELIDPGKFRMKILVYGLSGLGKTTFIGTVAPPETLGIAACETGQGNGILTIAHKDVDFCTPASLAELESLANGAVFKDKSVIALDSLSYMNKSFIREAALAMPRKGLDSPKRAQGIPELDDFGSMAEMTRRVLAKLLAQDKHLIVTATEKTLSPNENNNVTETVYLPDLPGALALTCTAMFDFVLRLRSRQRLADPKDAKSRFVERYWITQPDGQGSIVKCRSNKNEVPFLEKEEVFDPSKGLGTFPYMLKKILANYEKG